MQRVIIATDSKYAAESINKWIAVWSENGWRDNRNKPVVNEMLLRKLAGMKESLNLVCTHNKGHAGDANNVKVDLMVRNELERTLPTCLLIARTPEINQSEDKYIQDILEALKHNEKTREQFIVDKGDLYYIDHNLPAHSRLRIVVPESSKHLLLKLAHDDPIYGGHLGRKKTKNKLIGYFWKGMQSDIDKYIESCSLPTP